MREATPPWRFPPASRAGTGAGPWRRPERRIGKPGEIRRRKVTGLMSQSVPMGPRAHAAPAGRGGRGGAGKRRRLCPPGRRTQSGLCGDDVRRTAGGKLWETIGRKGWTFPAEAPRKLHGAPWQVRGMVARPPDPLHPTNMQRKEELHEIFEDFTHTRPGRVPGAGDVPGHAAHRRIGSKQFQYHFPHLLPGDRGGSCSRVQ